MAAAAYPHCWLAGSTDDVVRGDVVRCVARRMAQKRLLKFDTILLGTPYLISLGLSKSAVAMVFLAGPISGLVVQPLIGTHVKSIAHFWISKSSLGVLADHSKSRFGRRRPYMLVGVIICTFGMLLLGFTRPFANIFTGAGSNAVRAIDIFNYL